jgi:hypothetical protein
MLTKYMIEKAAASLRYVGPAFDLAKNLSDLAVIHYGKACFETPFLCEWLLADRAFATTTTVPTTMSAPEQDMS